MRRAQTVIIDNVAGGIVKNLSPASIPANAWSDGLNVRFKYDQAETSPGWLKFTSQTLGSTVKHISQFYKLDGTDFAVALTNSKIWYFDTGTSLWVNDSGVNALTGIDDDFVQSDTAFDLFVYTNNVDRVKKWTGPASGISDLGGLDTAEDGVGGTVDVQSAKGITSFAGFMHVVNTIEDGDHQSQRWRWSRFGFGEEWDNVSTYGQAGFADLTDGPDKLQTAKRLGGDFLVLYKERSIHVAQFVGPPTVWSRRLVVAGMGLIAPGAVADLVNEHIFVGPDNFYIFNGLNIKPVGTPIYDAFIADLNPSKSHLIWAHTDFENHEVIFGYPSGASIVPNKAVVLNYLTGAWSFRDMPFFTMGPFRRTTSADPWDSDTETWDEDTTRWDDSHYVTNAPLHLGGDGSGYIYDYGNGHSQDGVSHNSYIISPAISTGNAAYIKRFFRVLLALLATGDHDLEVWYLTVDNPNATLNWSQSTLIACDLSSQPWVNIDIAGRFLFLKFRTNGIDIPWKMNGYGYDSIVRGFY